MQYQQRTTSNQQRTTILAGTLIVGALDILDPILFAYFYRGTSPTRVLQGIASGLLGRSAFEGGVATAWLGLALHFFIAFCVVAFYHLASRWMPILVKHPIICGAIYGMLVHLLMRHVVIPLSAIGGPARPIPLPSRINLYFAHIFLVGIPTALLARHSYRTRPKHDRLRRPDPADGGRGDAGDRAGAVGDR